MKKIIKIVLVILWMILIFMLSNQSGNESQSLSDNIICSFMNNCNPELYSFIVRKAAHFMLYFILGILTFINFKSNKENMIYALIICVIYAFTDEIHQMFVNSRSGELRDIIIDSLGALSSILIMYKIRKRD